MIADAIRDALTADPFEPFRIMTSGGESFVVRDPQTVALMKSRVFIAHPKGDKWTFLLYLHIAGIESVTNGTNGHGRQRRRR
jgi:hypothetical protein